MTFADSSLAEWTAAIAAMLGLAFIGVQIAKARTAFDLQVLQTFLKDAKEHEKSLALAKSSSEKEYAFVEFMNFLEIYSAAVNSRLLPEVSRRIVSQKIQASLEVVRHDPVASQWLADAITDPNTFEEVSKFSKLK